MQLRVKPSAWITTSGLSPDWTRSTARIRISSRVLWSRARASRRFMSHCTICLLTYELVNIFVFQGRLFPSDFEFHAEIRAYIGRVAAQPLRGEPDPIASRCVDRIRLERPAPRADGLGEVT